MIVLVFQVKQSIQNINSDKIKFINVNLYILYT